VQNRQLQTWLSEDEYAQIEGEWQNTKKALGNTVTLRVSEVMFCVTIEWE
jgi:hypothetical protein|tara:strand:- start:4759 stop:4908 length:150 start_codon:yes stop_codon:yes gene_type:complete